MPAVISIGNPLKGDDNIGNVLLESLRPALEERGWKLFRGEENPENFALQLSQSPPDRLFFLDAVDFGGEPGETRTFNLEEFREQKTSTHSMPLKIFSQLLKGTEMRVIGIQPKDISFRDSLSPDLEIQVKAISDRIRFMLLKV